MDNDQKKVIHEGEIVLGSFAIPCYVLDDGTRILSSNAMQNALKLQDESENSSGTRLARYMNQASLKPFIYNNKPSGHYDPIICYQGNKKINGYEATVL